MRHTPQQLEEMLSAWEEQSQPVIQPEQPSAEVIQLRAPQAGSMQQATPEPTQAEAVPTFHPEVLSSNPITDFGVGDILPKPKVRKNLRKRSVELRRDPSTGDISGFDIFDEEN